MRRIILTILLCLPQLVHGFDYVVPHLEYVSKAELESMRQSGLQDIYVSDPNKVGVPDPDSCGGQEKCWAMAIVAAPAIGKIVAIVGVAIIAGVVGWAVKSETQEDKDRRRLGRSANIDVSDEELVNKLLFDAAQKRSGVNLGRMLQIYGDKDLVKKELSDQDYQDYMYAKEKIILRGNRGSDQDPDPKGWEKLYKPVNQDGKFGKINEVTHEIYVKDPSRHGGPHWEVYRNRIEWKNGNRSHKVYEGAGPFQYGKRMTLDNKPLVR